MMQVPGCMPGSCAVYACHTQFALHSKQNSRLMTLCSVNLHYCF